MTSRALFQAELSVTLRVTIADLMPFLSYLRATIGGEIAGLWIRLQAR